MLRLCKAAIIRLRILEVDGFLVQLNKLLCIDFYTVLRIAIDTMGMAYQIICG